MKFFITLAIIATISSMTLCCTGNDLRVDNLDYVQNATGIKEHFSFKYANMTMKYHVLNVTDVDGTIFKFIWNYSSEEEKTKGHEIIQSIGADFEELREDWGFVIVFFGKHIQKLKFYKKTEFGSAYTIEFLQNGTPIQLQFQIKADQPNQEEFNEIINKIIEKREGKKFLEYIE